MSFILGIAWLEKKIIFLLLIIGLEGNQSKTYKSNITQTSTFS